MECDRAWLQPTAVKVIKGGKALPEPDINLKVGVQVAPLTPELNQPLGF